MILQYFFGFNNFTRLSGLASLSHLPPAMGQRGSHQEVQWWNLQLKSTGCVGDERWKIWNNAKPAKQVQVFRHISHISRWWSRFFHATSATSAVGLSRCCVQRLNCTCDSHRFKRAIRAVSCVPAQRWKHGKVFQLFLARKTVATSPMAWVDSNLLRPILADFLSLRASLCCCESRWLTWYGPAGLSAAPWAWGLDQPRKNPNFGNSLRPWRARGWARFTTTRWQIPGTSDLMITVAATGNERRWAHNMNVFVL